MTDREALLAAVIADPLPDGPRLVFADWLEEHGENDLGEFVRVQCEAERHRKEARWDRHCHSATVDSPCDCDDCRKCRELGKRETRLLGEHYLHWSPAHWKSWPGKVFRAHTLEHNAVMHDNTLSGGSEWVVFRRGLVDEARLIWDTLLRHGRDFFAAHPATSLRGFVGENNLFWTEEVQDLVVVNYRRPLRNYLLGPGYPVLLADVVRLDEMMRLAFHNKFYTCRYEAVGACDRLMANWGRSLAGLPPIGGG